jgi:hypothetical protein
LGLLFAKSTVGWRGIMTELPLPHKVARTVGGGIVFLIGEKIVSSDFGGATHPRLQTPDARLQAKMLGPDPRTGTRNLARGQTSAPGSSTRLRTPGPGAAMPWALGKLAHLTKDPTSGSTDPCIGCRPRRAGLQTHEPGTATQCARLCKPGR